MSSSFPNYLRMETGFSWKFMFRKLLVVIENGCSRIWEELWLHTIIVILLLCYFIIIFSGRSSSSSSSSSSNIVMNVRGHVSTILHIFKNTATVLLLSHILCRVWITEFRERINGPIKTVVKDN